LTGSHSLLNSGALLRYGAIALLLSLPTGCRRANHFYEKVAHGARPSAAMQLPGRLAQQGYAAITGECAHQTFANARTGLVAGVTGLNEDVFELRDRTTLQTLAFGLEEAQRLESMLRVSLPPNDADQSVCVRQFDDYLESLTDPLVESTEVQKQIDTSAFNDYSKHEQEELDKAQRMEEASKAAAQSQNKNP